MSNTDILLKGIDLYIVNYENARKAFIESNNTNIGIKKAGFDRGELKKQIFGNIPSSKNGINLDDFIEDLADWKRFKTFETIEIAEDVLKGFKALEFELPSYAALCYNEVKERTSFINAFIEKGVYPYSEREKEAFNQRLNKELKETTFNKETREQALRDVFSKKVQSVKDFNKKVLDDYGYYIDSLYEDDSFIGDAYSINQYFFEGEKRQGTVKVFGELQKIFMDYLNLKNEVIQIQDLLMNTDKKIKVKETIAPEGLKLENLFDSITRLKKVKEILVLENLVQENTYLWKDESKGNKAFLAALIKHFHSQGYFKDNKRPTTEQIVGIAKNSFGWPLSKHTVIRAKPTDFPFPFIPPASTL